MRQVKLFKSIENELEQLEKDVNDWISSTGHEIISVTGNISPQTHFGGDHVDSFSSSDVLVIVTYEASNG